MTIDENRVIARYIAGDGVREIAAAFEIATQTVYNILDRNHVKRRNVRLQEQVTRLLNACQDGASLARTAEHLDISESTATRAVRKYRDNGGVLELKKGRQNLSHPFTRDFPYPQISTDEIGREFDRLKLVVSHLDNGKIRPQTHVGIRLCAPFFPNRYAARSGKNISAVEAWYDPIEIQKAIQFQIDHDDPVTPKRVLRAVTMRCRTPTIFRPAVAKFIYERYCPRGGRVWDPCSGYGGRLLGAAAAGVHYIGTDVDEATVEGNRNLARAVNVIAEVHAIPAEEFKPANVDLVFTSPPYFDRERYSGGAQSWRRHGAGVDTWIAGFLRPVIERARQALPARGYLVLNIADLRANGKIIPLVARTINAAVTAGFKHEETLQMPLAAINRKAPSEPVLVLRKIER